MVFLLEFFGKIIGDSMFSIFRSSIPSREVILQLLPQEYKNEPGLFYEKKVADDLVETDSKINILLTKRELFFSRKGYLTKDEAGTPYRIWARLHYDEKQQPNGMILCMISEGFFTAWKGCDLCLEDKSVQSISWEQNPNPKFTFTEKSRGGNFVPSLFQTMLKREEETEDSPMISCDIKVFTKEEVAKFREFCGTAQLPLPPKLYEAVYPKSSLQRVMPHIALAGVLVVAYYFWSRFKS